MVAKATRGGLSFDPGQLPAPSSARVQELPCVEILQALGTSLFHAIDACLAARVQLPQSPILHQTPASHLELTGPERKQTTEIVAELLESKQADGLSRRYIETLRSHLVRFESAFQ